jgi:hypothetical protein
MESSSLVVRSDGGASAVTIDRKFGEFSILVSDFEDVTGWVLKPEGLCKDATCMPVFKYEVLTDGLSIDLVEFARLTNQNVVIDTKFGVAALGESASNRGAIMHSLDAPDFTLPDIYGKQLSFSDFNRRKRLLLAWSSW